ncbi:MAG: DUF1684 domain-containing protein [Bacteroidetes bacterium]|nr:DUF1684 domain-containing protein [Bacteroidota bacterium]
MQNANNLSFMKFSVVAFLLSFSFGLAFGQVSPAAIYAKEILKFRDDYKQSFLHNARSPLKLEDINSLRFFDANLKYKVACTFKRTPNEKQFELPTSNGKTKPFVKYGVLSFELDGKKMQLAVYQNLTVTSQPKYAQHLFLPFRDETNGDTTYGGGRFIDMTIPEVEAANPIIDFNKCYNPWCHYSDGFSCPIPPVANTLKVEIPAGEKNWVGQKKH